MHGYFLGHRSTIKKIIAIGKGLGLSSEGYESFLKTGNAAVYPGNRTGTITGVIIDDSLKRPDNPLFTKLFIRYKVKMQSS